MHSISQELDQLLDRLDSETALLLERAVRDAVALANKRTSVAEDVDALGYPAGYFLEATAGSFQNEALDAPPDLPLDTREPW